MLKERYNSTKGVCAHCGCYLKTAFGDPLGYFFTMDKEGNFYCAKCELFIFEDGDERIYDPNLEEEEEIMFKTWEDAAKYCEDVFGAYVDWDERFFHCVECDDVIYECDWPNHDWSMCPVCENQGMEVE